MLFCGIGRDFFMKLCAYLHGVVIFEKDRRDCTGLMAQFWKRTVMDRILIVEDERTVRGNFGDLQQNTSVSRHLF